LPGLTNYTIEILVSSDLLMTLSYAGKLGHWDTSDLPLHPKQR